MRRFVSPGVLLFVVMLGVACTQPATPTQPPAAAPTSRPVNTAIPPALAVPTAAVPSPAATKAAAPTAAGAASPAATKAGASAATGAAPAGQATGAAGGATQANAAAGAQAFVDKTCSSCHGAKAEGNVGPKIAGTALSQEQVQQIVRQGKDVMPAFPPNRVSDQDIANIYAWLRSLPR